MHRRRSRSRTMPIALAAIAAAVYLVMPALQHRAHAATVYFTAGYESGKAGDEWFPNGDGGNQTGGAYVTTDIAHTGTHSWKAYNDPSLPSPDNISAKLLRWRFDYSQAYYTTWFNWPTDYTVSGHGTQYANIFQWKQRRPSANGAFDPTWIVAVKNSLTSPGQDEFVLQDWHNAVLYRTGVLVPKGRWVQLQAYMKTGVTNGAITVWLDGKQIWSKSNINTLGTPVDTTIPYDMWGIGNYADAGIGKWIYFDDASVSDSYMAPSTSTTTTTASASDTSGPSVSVNAPVSGSTVSGPTSVGASASDPSGVAKVEFYLDGTLKSTQTSAPYCMMGSRNGSCLTWDSTTVANGTHTITAKAYDSLGNVSSASSSFTVSNPTTLISEGFSDASAASHFTSSGGAWSVGNGVYALSAPVTTGTYGNPNNAVDSTSVSGDFVMSADGQVVASSSAWNDFSITFGYRDTKNYYFASFNESNNSSTNGIFKVVNGVQTQIGDFSSTIAAGSWYRIKVVRSGGRISVYRNGTLVGSVMDSTFTSGRVGFGSRNDPCYFDNLVVTH